MKYTVFDIESDGLIDTATKVHCLAYAVKDGNETIERGVITNPANMVEFLESQQILAGHNIARFDIPLMEKLYNLKYKGVVIDTLGLSWYLYPIAGFRHSLEHWGERLGIKKLEIEDWHNLRVELYIERCKTDVKINIRLMKHFMDYLGEIYDNDGDLERIIRYIAFKMDCLKDQELHGITLDRRLAEESKLNLEFIIEEKLTALRDRMPSKYGNVRKTLPKVMYKKDGSLSSHGATWLEELNKAGLPADSTELREPPNPASHQQMKQWLYELGWKPLTFKESASEGGKKVPQISLPFGAGLCPSVLLLIEKYPFLEPLDGLYKARHRLSLFDGFLEEVDDKGKIYSSAHGFTNTMRLQHSKPIVNLPQPFRFFGKEVRGCLTIPSDDYVMIGADISGLEDNTKQHFIYYYDPQYVKEMQIEGFDPHLDIGVLAGLLTEQEVKFYKSYREEIATKEQKEKYEKIKSKRNKAKTVNFSATYGAGPPKIAETLRCPITEATTLWKTYWSRNKAITQVANACKIKKVKGQSWLFNSVSSFWLFLKTDKDRFSTLNQNTGVYVFDAWVSGVRRRLKPFDIPVLLQYHDELMLVCKKEDLNFVVASLQESINEVNDELRLNVLIHISIATGKNYAECH